MRLIDSDELIKDDEVNLQLSSDAVVDEIRREEDIEKSESEEE